MTEKREPVSGDYAMLVALWPIAGGEWKPGQRFRWATREDMPLPNPKPLIALACEPDHPDWVGVLLEVQGFNDQATGKPCGLARIDHKRERARKIAIDTETEGGPWWLPPDVGSPMFPREETAAEKGTRIHKYLEQELKGAKLVAQVHDELMLEVPTDLTNGRAAYRCANRACPDRQPTRASCAPTCYTCGRPMAVALWPEPQSIVAQKRVGDLMARALAAVKPMFTFEAEPKLARQWVKQIPKQSPGEIREWINARRAWRDHPPSDDRAFAIDVATGDQLDALARVAGIVRRPSIRKPELTSDGFMFGAEHPETDADLRVRLLAARESRPDALVIAEHAVGTHPDVIAVRAEMRAIARPSPLVYVEVTLAPDKMTDALVRELDDRLRRALPVTYDYQLDVVYSQT